MSSGHKRNLARTSAVAVREHLPTWCAHESIALLETRKRILKFKGFGGGVPLNTETAAVNPRVGIE